MENISSEKISEVEVNSENFFLINTAISKLMEVFTVNKLERHIRYIYENSNTGEIFELTFKKIK